MWPVAHLLVEGVVYLGSRLQLEGPRPESILRAP